MLGSMRALRPSVETFQMGRRRHRRKTEMRAGHELFVAQANYQSIKEMEHCDALRRSNDPLHITRDQQALPRGPSRSWDVDNECRRFETASMANGLEAGSERRSAVNRRSFL